MVPYPQSLSRLPIGKAVGEVGVFVRTEVPILFKEGLDIGVGRKEGGPGFRAYDLKALKASRGHSAADFFAAQVPGACTFGAERGHGKGPEAAVHADRGQGQVHLGKHGAQGAVNPGKGLGPQVRGFAVHDKAGLPILEHPCKGKEKLPAVEPQ